jgi:acetate kinase
VRILVINSGSSSLKYAVFEGEAMNCVASENLGKPPGGNAGTALDSGKAISQIKCNLAGAPIHRIGHRVVHGGAEYTQTTPIDARVKQGIAALAEIAPLHNPPALAAIEAAEAAFPGVPQVAVFDTAFFATLPESAVVYPLPFEWRRDWGIRRYGFHGISHAYCAGRAAEFLGRSIGGLRVIVCHLGNGCSASAVRDGAAIYTTMGFTPLDGLMMGTRPGSLDPGILPYLESRHHLSSKEMESALNHRSGLLGVSGVSSDYREVEQAAASGHARAQLALDMFTRRVRAHIGQLAVTLEGVDVLVFTAGIGENSSSLRAAVCAPLACLGLRIDPEKNRQARPDADVSATDSIGRILVLKTREDLMIARETKNLALTEPAVK